MALKALSMRPFDSFTITASMRETGAGKHSISFRT